MTKKRKRLSGLQWFRNKKTVDKQELNIVILMHYIGALGILTEQLMGRIPDSNVLYTYGWVLNKNVNSKGVQNFNYHK